LLILASVLLVATARITFGAPTRFAAALSTSLGSLGVAFLVFISIMPVGYFLSYGLLLLRAWIGWAFFISFAAGAYVFLACGTRIREPLHAPRRDKPLALALSLALAVLVSTAAVAALVPALRASRVPPIVALRGD